MTCALSVCATVLVKHKQMFMHNPYQTHIRLRFTLPIILASLDLVCEKQRRRPACADAQKRRLISVFVICVKESMISRPDISEISIFFKVSVAEKASFNFTFSGTPKTGLLASQTFPVWGGIPHPLQLNIQ